MKSLMHLTCVLCIFNAFLLFFFSFLGQLILETLNILLQHNASLALCFFSQIVVVWKAAKRFDF